MSYPLLSARLAAPLALSLALGSWGCSSDDPLTSGGDMLDDEDHGDGGASAGRDASGGGKTPDGGTGLPPTKPDDGVDKCAGIRKDAPAGQGAVDVIFIIDTSGSMAPIILQVQNNIEAFIKDFEGSSADTRVTLITLQNLAAGTSVESETDRYRFVRSSVDSKALYSVALATFPQYQDFLRPNAATQFVMITDDEDLIPYQTFHDQMAQQLGHEFTQHAIASEDNMGKPCALPGADVDPICAIPVGIPFLCSASAIGANYYALADQTMGEKISICTTDFTPVFDRLHSAVIAAVPLPCDYALTEATNPDFDPNKVQVVYTPQGGDDQEFPRASDASKCGDKVGWYYDDPNKPTSIGLCPSACTQVANGGAMDIAFGCVPLVFL